MSGNKNNLKISSNAKPMKWEKVVVTKNNDLAYIFKDDQNGNRSIFVSNVTPGKRCFWCLRDIQGTMLKTNTDYSSRGIGIPIERTLDGYICEGSFCTHNKLSCAYAWIKRELNKDLQFRDPIFFNSIHLLHSMYKDLYTDDMNGSNEKNMLEQAIDYRLLESNGGNLSSEEFDKYKGVNINNANQNIVFSRTLSYKYKNPSYSYQTHNTDIVDCSVEYISSLSYS